MAKIPGGSGGGDFKIHPEEDGEGVVLGWFDHGEQIHPKYGKQWKVALKVMSTTHSYDHTYEDDSGNEVSEKRPFVISHKVNLSTGERSFCHKWRKKLLGRKLTKSENNNLALVNEEDPESQGWEVRYEIEHNTWAPPGGEEMTFANIAFLKVMDRDRKPTEEELELCKRIQEAIYERAEDANGDDDEAEADKGGVLDSQMTARNLVRFLSDEKDVYSFEKAENYMAFIYSADDEKLKRFIAKCEEDAKGASVEIPAAVYDSIPF